MINRLLFIFVFFFVCALFPSSVFADGTVTGTIVGPHGETAAVSYTFTQGSTTVTGTTNSSGVFSQSLANGDWAFSATPPASFEYAATINIPTLRIGDGDAFDIGTIPFHFQVPAGTDSDLEEFAAEPPICSQTGTPVIIRTYYEDEEKGNFLFQGRSANVIVVADETNYTVEVDYSYLEGDYEATAFSNSNTETAVHQGNGTYKATHTIALATVGGGMPLIKVTTSGGGSSTYTCLDGGPVNLDIRSFFTGSDTTDFSAVTDFRSIPNFTMHQNNVVKVRFSQSINMLDPTVQKFMKSIAAKMVSSTGSLNFDARAVLELKNAGASVTFYNINVNSPRILVDGVEDLAVTTNITYDKIAKTLTFGAAHFTIFTVVDANSSSSSTTSSPRMPNFRKGEGGNFMQDNAWLIMEPYSIVDFDSYLSVDKKRKVHPAHFGKFWQISDIYDIWLKDHYNYAKILPTFFHKNPIISLSYTPESLTVDGKYYFPEASLRLAFSGNSGNTWKILPTSVVDVKNNTVAALHKVGGSYMIVGNSINQQRRSN